MSNGFDINEIYRNIPGEKVTTLPLDDRGSVNFHLPDRLAADKEQIVKDLWGG